MIASAIIPARDEEAFLGACLDALAAQRVPGVELECIVVDNGSTDGTVSLARQRGAKVVDAGGVPLGELRNLGVQRARGEVLAFVDADITVQPGWLAAALAHLQEPGVVAAGCYPRVPDGSTWVQRHWSQLVRRAGEGPRDVGWLPSANLLVRREPFERSGGFDARLASCEDADLTFRLGQQGRIVYDHAIDALHHREPPDLRAFFRKELWHGHGSFDGLARGRFSVAELPSLVAPSMVVVGELSLLVALPMALVGAPAAGPLAVVGLLFVLVPPGAWTLRAALGKGRWAQLPGDLLLYLLYFQARAQALVGFLGRRLRGRD